jgi:AcrR family transcriptional regulator
MADIGTSRRRFRRAPEEKRALILSAARRCFSERPYPEVATAEIARRAGVSEGTVFHHFGSKLKLLQVVASEYGRDLIVALAEGTEDGPNDMHVMAQRAYDFVEREGTLGLSVGNEAEQPIHVIWAAIREQAIAGGVLALEHWHRMGLVRPMNPRIVAEILFPMLNGLLLRAIMRGERIPEEHLKEAQRCFEGALRP